MSMTAIKCGLCEENEMVPAKLASGEDSTFMVCPNCDSPKGISPPNRVEDEPEPLT